MKDELEDLMGAATARADYADVRHVATNLERISTRNGAVDEVERSESEGVGVRVRVGGAWGFAATRDTTKAGAEGALAQALAIARAQPSAEATPLAPEPPARGEHRGGDGTDPFEVPLERKLERLLEADAACGSDSRLNL
ncbi:MAG: TldD protein, partial [Thermoleophilaceae bacterium]|nr:TldD protein [Thermoleophilaceae bacterium]